MLVLPAVWARGSLVDMNPPTLPPPPIGTRRRARERATHLSSVLSLVPPLRPASPHHLSSPKTRAVTRARATSGWNLAAPRGRSRAEPWFRREIRAGLPLPPRGRRSTRRRSPPPSRCVSLIPAVALVKCSVERSLFFLLFVWFLSRSPFDLRHRLPAWRSRKENSFFFFLVVSFVWRFT